MTDALPAIAELQARPQWVAWHWEKVQGKDGKPTKPPYVANNGSLASSTDPTTWMAYAKAEAAFKKAGHDGLGFVVTADDPYCGIDLDHCRDKATGAIDAWAMTIVTALDSYTEVTPSGEGLRVWIMTGEWIVDLDRHTKSMADRLGAKADAKIEIYDRKRYFTVTGNHLPSTPTTINERGAALAALCDELWLPQPVSASTAPATAGRSLSAQQVVALMKKAKNSATIERLMAGDMSDYNDDHSRADEALCCLIVFYSRDSEVIDQVFRQSKLAERGKWNRADYRDRTITKALATVTETYQAVAVAPTLPDEFWNARPRLRLIRQAAHSRARSGDAVLGVVLTRVSAGVPHQLRIPAIVGTATPLNLFVNLMGGPGSGKSSGNGVGVEILPLVHPVDEPGKIAVADQLPIGSGEGLVEALFELVAEKDEFGKVRMVKRLMLHNAAFYVDEGSVLSALGNRAGSVLLPTLRTIFTGGTLGQSNASMERKRIVPAGQYAIGVVVALQDELAGAFLEGEAAGTPQRFLWLSATDPSIRDDAPPWPSDGLPLNLDHTYRARGDRPHDMVFADSIRDEVSAASRARSRGEVVVEPLQAHADLIRLKLAALLAIIDGRLDVNAEDWELATMIKTTSDGVLAHVQAQVGRAEARKESQTSKRLADRQVVAVAAVAAHRSVECAERIHKKVKAEPGVTVAVIRRGLRAWADVFNDGLEHALAQKWVVEKWEAGQGADKHALYPVRAGQ